MNLQQHGGAAQGSGSVLHLDRTDVAQLRGRDGEVIGSFVACDVYWVYWVYHLLGLFPGVPIDAAATRGKFYISSLMNSQNQLKLNADRCWRRRTGSRRRGF